MEKEKGLTAAGVKTIAMICMFIDHAAASVYQGLFYSKIFSGGSFFDEGVNFFDALTANINAPLYLLLRAIGRISFPIYCFFIVEGLKYTHSRWKYLLRLIIFALISEIPFDMAIFGRVIYASYQNVYFTLALGLAMIWMIDALWEKQIQQHFRVLLAIGASLLGGFNLAKLLYSYVLEGFISGKINTNAAFTGVTVTTVIATAVVISVLYYIKKKELAYRISLIMCAAGAACLIADQTMFLHIQTDYGALGIITILLMYLFRNKKPVSISSGTGFLALMNVSEVPGLAAIPVIMLYNGKRGKYNKYIFYIFYPAHLLLLGVICLILNLTPMG